MPQRETTPVRDFRLDWAYVDDDRGAGLTREAETPEGLIVRVFRGQRNERVNSKRPYAIHIDQHIPHPHTETTSLFFKVVYTPTIEDAMLHAEHCIAYAVDARRDYDRAWTTTQIVAGYRPHGVFAWEDAYGA